VGVVFVVTQVLLFSAGMSVAGLHDARNEQWWFGDKINARGSYMVRIAGTPRVGQRSVKVPVEIIASVDSGKVGYVTGKAFVYVQQDDNTPSVQRGDTLLLPGRWEVIKDAGNPYEFSYAAYCARNNIRYRQWCGVEDVQLYGRCQQAALPLTERCHDWCMQQLSRHLGNHKSMGLMQAMLLGDEVNLDEDLRQAYANTGIIHIIAISGGNVSIFFVVIAFLLGFVRHPKHLLIKYAIAMPLVWFYVLMAGAQPSAVRAAVMFSILALGMALQKNKNGTNQLLATAFLLLCMQPAWLFSAGFQLSFVAVLSIQLFYGRIYNLVRFPAIKISKKGIVNKLKRWVLGWPQGLWSAVAMSIAAEILIAPLVIYHFHTFPVMFIVANVAALLFMSVVLVAGIVLVVVSSIPVLAGVAAWVIIYLVDGFGYVVGLLQDIGPDYFNHLLLSGAQVMLVYAIIGWLGWYLIRRSKTSLVGSLMVGCLLAASVCQSSYQHHRQRRIVVYNTPHATHAELINGTRYSVIATDRAASEQIGYATGPAHIAWQAWQEQVAPAHNIYLIDGKVVLVLHSSVSYTAPTPVHTLILAAPTLPPLPALVAQYKPQVVVVGNQLARKQMQALAEICRENKIALHHTGTMGAYVMGE
jgi:competence protein ComEC